VDTPRAHHRLSGTLPRIARPFGVLGGVLCVIALGTRCAHVEPPSGGPVDATPPAVAAVYPAPGALNVPRDARAVFQFTEWIDRNAARGTVLVSPPYAGRVRLEVDGDRLTVLPPAGQMLRPGTTHAVTVLGTLKDLRGNVMGRSFSLRFSTGAVLDSAAVSGMLAVGERRGNLVVALYQGGDRTAAPAPGALSPRDTGFRAGILPEPWRELPAYLAATDSNGRFHLDGAVAGDYALFAFEDLNGNFAFDMGFESAATGELSVALRPRAPEQSLRLVPLDTLPLRLAEVTFEARTPLDTATVVEVPETLPGTVRVKFSRAPHPARAVEAARYRVLPDSGEPVPVTAVAWSPQHNAWVLETPALRANTRHRVEMRGRPEFPGRPGTDVTDTSVVFLTEASVTAAADRGWSVNPLRTATGPSGLPRVAAAPAVGGTQLFISNRPLSPRLRSTLEDSLEVLAGPDTLPVPHRVRITGLLAFTLELSRPLRTGDALRLRLRQALGDTASRTLYSGSVADSAQSGELVLRPAASRRDWTFWLSSVLSVGGVEDYGLVRSGDVLSAAGLPAGHYRLQAFRDRDGDGIWDPGALKPWIPQEPFETLLDTVTVVPGTVTDVTERVRF
jgi:hypothetical protein